MISVMNLVNEMATSDWTFGVALGQVYTYPYLSMYLHLRSKNWVYELVGGAIRIIYLSYLFVNTLLWCPYC